MKETDIKNDETEFDNEDYSVSKNNVDLNLFISRFFRVLLIHKWLFIAIFLFVILLVGLYVVRQPRLYQANYEVFYNENIREFVDDSNVPVVKSDFDKNYWLRAMQSDNVMRITLKNSGLTYNVNTLKKMMSIGLVDKRKEDRIPVYLVQITSSKKEQIPIIIRAYINALNTVLLENQVQNSERLVNYLSGQINQNNLKLDQMDVQIDHQGVGNSEIVDFDKIRSSLDDFRKDLMNARVNLSSIISARQKTESALKNLDGTIVNESAFSEPLKVQLMNLEVDLARALTKNKEDHPAVKQIRANIKQISSMLRDSLEQRMEVKSLVQNPLKSQLMSKLLDLQISEVSEETRVKSLEQVIQELEAKSMPGAVNQDQQQQLRNREMISLTLKQLNDKLIEAQSASHGSLSRFVYIDDPSSIFIANKGLLYYLLLGLLSGLILAAMVVFIYDMLDDRIMLADDYAHFYNYPLLGIVRHYHNDEALDADIHNTSKSLSAGELSGLIVSLRQLMKRKDVKSLVVSSPDRQEGKTLVSFKLAGALALKKQKVLLVDLDFFSPKLTKKLYPEIQYGLSDYILNEKNVDDIVLKTEVENLYFVPAGITDGKKELFYNDPKMAEFIRWAKEKYDVIIFDTPAAMYIPDVLEFYGQIDSVIVVARLKKTTRRLLDRLFGIFKSFKISNVNVILNDFQTTNLKAYSNYSYYYSEYNDYADNTKSHKNRFLKPRNVVILILLLLLIVMASYIILNQRMAI